MAGSKEEGVKSADVCLVLEGSYPYAPGGVSTWTHDLIRSLPDLTFHLWCLVARKSDIDSRYELHPNVTGTTNVVLFEEPKRARPSALTRPFWDSVKKFHQTPITSGRRGEILWTEIVQMLMKKGSVPAHEMLLGESSYKVLLGLYNEKGIAHSFLDYYYTFLFTHMPMFKLLSGEVPNARLYHAISTGYAGFLGCMAKRRTGAPLLLTEHGIYTNERQVEISLADWIYSRRDRKIQVGRTGHSLKKIWISLFDFLSRLTYAESDRITTLFGGNRDMEVRFGADPSKIEIIPNGVDLEHYAKIPRTVDPKRPLVGLVGRVVPIKDIRTFIKACRVVADRVPEARFVVLGSYDQTPAYYEKCLEYRRLMNLDDRLTFTGNVKVDEYYSKLSVIVLTSISEALPLVVIEAMAVGIPQVTTRVGSCEELLYGHDEEDQKLGASGVVANVGDHQEVGEGIIKVLTRPKFVERCIQAGRKRVARYYDIRKVQERYAQLYRSWLGREEKH